MVGVEVRIGQDRAESRHWDAITHLVQAVEGNTLPRDFSAEQAVQVVIRRAMMQDIDYLGVNAGEEITADVQRQTERTIVVCVVYFGIRPKRVEPAYRLSQTEQWIVAQPGGEELVNIW